MKKKLYSIVALLCMAVTCTWAQDYGLTAITPHGTVTFLVDGIEVTSAAEGDEVTVNIVEDEGWKVYDVTAEAFAEWSDAQSRRNIPVVDKSIDLIPVDGIDNQWVFTMKSAKAVVTVDYDAILQDAWIQSIADQTYTGSELTPSLTVLFGSTPLTADEHFTVEWADNVTAGTATVTLSAVERTKLISLSLIAKA